MNKQNIIEGATFRFKSINNGTSYCLCIEHNRYIYVQCGTVVAKLNKARMISNTVLFGRGRSVSKDSDRNECSTELDHI